MSVIKEGGGTSSREPSLPRTPRCTYFRYGKYGVGEVHGDVRRERVLPARGRERERERERRGNGRERGITMGARTSGLAGLRERGSERKGERESSERLRCFQNILLRFLRLAPCCRPLKGRIRVRRLPPPSLSRCPPALSLSPRITFSRSLVPLTLLCVSFSLEALRNSRQPSLSGILQPRIFLRSGKTSVSRVFSFFPSFLV